MCGICGKLSLQTAADGSLIEAMNDCMAHRGPNAAGVHLETPIALGHRRLSILDTSAAGTQPMQDATKRFTITYNGEIYNFNELKAELQREENINFRTGTDTEVLLEAYKTWGRDCLSKLNGMFAFGIWDNIRQELFLARDRLGKKPLYYTMLPCGGITFASTLEAVLEEPSVRFRLNPKALSHYLSLNYTLNSECFVEPIEKLPPASWMLATAKGIKQQGAYWDLAACFKHKTRFNNEREACEALTGLLDDATRIRLVSDVPLGAFLSGGVDSSAIVASMRRQLNEDATHTFSVGFAQQDFSELPMAQLVANHLAVRHHDDIVAPEAGLDLASLLDKLDEPFADSSIIPTYYLSEFAEKNVKVCLSGDGGDELFAGYPTYTADKLRHLTQWIPQWTSSLAEKAARKCIPTSHGKVSLDYKIRQFFQEHSGDACQAHYGWRRIFSERDKAEILLPDIGRKVLQHEALEIFRQYESHVADCHYLDRAMYTDIKTWLIDDILVKVDRSSMAHGLEVRAPLLDHRLVEFAASLPVSLKLKGFKKKYLFRQSQRNRLPRKVIDQPKKGFNAPISSWLGQELLSETQSFASPGCPLTPYFSRKAITGLVERHLNKTEDNGLKLFSLFMLKGWLQRFGHKLSTLEL